MKSSWFRAPNSRLPSYYNRSNGYPLQQIWDIFTFKLDTGSARLLKTIDSKLPAWTALCSNNWSKIRFRWCSEVILLNLFKVFRRYCQQHFKRWRRVPLGQRRLIFRYIKYSNFHLGFWRWPNDFLLYALIRFRTWRKF